VADSVRLALPGEARQIAEVQRRSWAATADADVAAALLATVDADAMAAAWEGAVRRPPEARFRILVAVEASRVAGFAVTRPGSDPDAEPAGDGAVEELTVDPVARRRGHGSRLLNACADTLRADGFRQATIWVASRDDELRRFLTAAGWAADGAHREIGSEDGQVRIRQVRLHTDLR
jgi:ribosomal protein S18 acetylase RimI-like enzyme